MNIVSVIIFILSLCSFISIVAGIVKYYQKSTSPPLKRIAEVSIPVFFVYILYREVLTFLDISPLFRYETELFAYLGLMAWLYLMNRQSHKREFVLMKWGLVILAVVFIVFYTVFFSLMYIEKLFGLCGFTHPCLIK